MKIFTISALVLALTGCSFTDSELEPIPGSITYAGQPRMKLTKAPVGGPVTSQFTDERGRQIYEVYRIQPDRSLKLVSRRFAPEFQSGFDTP